MFHRRSARYLRGFQNLPWFSQSRGYWQSLPKRDKQHQRYCVPKDKDVVANHNDHKGCRSEAPPGDVAHHSDMVPEGETQPDNPGRLVLLEVHESQ